MPMAMNAAICKMWPPIGPSVRSFKPLPSVLPSYSAAQALRGGRASLVRQATFLRGARRFRRAAHLRLDERLPDQIGQALERFAPVLLLCAVIARDDEERPVVDDAAPGDCAQPSLDVPAECSAALQV